MCLPLADSCQPRMDRARVDGSQPLGRIHSDDDACSLAEIASLRRKSGPLNGLSLSCAQKRRAHHNAGDCCVLESICRRSTAAGVPRLSWVDLVRNFRPRHCDVLDLRQHPLLETPISLTSTHPPRCSGQTTAVPHA